MEMQFIHTLHEYTQGIRTGADHTSQEVERAI